MEESMVPSWEGGPMDELMAPPLEGPMDEFMAPPPGEQPMEEVWPPSGQVDDLNAPGEVDSERDQFGFEEPGVAEDEQLDQTGKETKNMRDEAETMTSMSQVNLLANLIRWVALAKRDVGTDQLAVFLETYAICGQLPPELKTSILRLAEVIDARSIDEDRADTWSRLLLELHGILTGGGTPPRPPESLWQVNEEIDEQAEASSTETEKREEEQVKLRLVLPTGSDGAEKEFNITLTPHAAGEID